MSQPMLGRILLHVGMRDMVARVVRHERLTPLAGSVRCRHAVRWPSPPWQLKSAYGYPGSRHLGHDHYAGHPSRVPGVRTADGHVRPSAPVW
jgi:hypothetical protein